MFGSGELESLEVKDAQFWRYKSTTIQVLNPVTLTYEDLTFAGNGSLCTLEKKCSSDDPAFLKWGISLTKTECLSKVIIRKKYITYHSRIIIA
jgi:hypothetical protein